MRGDGDITDEGKMSEIKKMFEYFNKKLTNIEEKLSVKEVKMFRKEKK